MMSIEDPVRIDRTGKGVRAAIIAASLVITFYGCDSGGWNSDSGTGGGGTGGSSASGGGQGQGGGSAVGGSGGGAGGGTGGGSGADAGSLLPTGNIPGTWTLAFHDEFDGTSLDTTKWTTEEGGTTNDVKTHTSNVTVSGGNAILALPSSNSGAVICTGSSCCPAAGGCFPTGMGGYDLPVGGYAEARILFPGDGTDIYNWPAWWTFGPGWPGGGEHDIAEGCGTLGANYHSPSVNGGKPIPGVWSNQFHIYGLHRKADSADVYYDGKLVRTYPTADDGSPQVLEVNVGNGCGGTPLPGPTADVLVDYVRAWE
jgi:hypothetical protein